MVGRMSREDTLPSSTAPASWPGAFTKRGAYPIWSVFLGSRSRIGPGVNETPWSAVMMIIV